MAVQVFSNTLPTTVTDTIVPYTPGTGSADYIVASVACDQAGTLFIEQSGDNTNWDVIDSVAITGGTPNKIKVDVILAFARARYKVTTTNATSFRLFLRTTSAGARP